ncbi:hypothetical protein, partial [Microcoleus sp. F4-D5]|uniref:hypothetical protein n=1 Tax=Microcoleus sp. F4-D5 TaxID=2818760 RepID=UPI002FD2F733
WFSHRMVLDLTFFISSTSLEKWYKSDTILASRFTRRRSPKQANFSSASAHCAVIVPLPCVMSFEDYSICLLIVKLAVGRSHMPTAPARVRSSLFCELSV